MAARVSAPRPDPSRNRPPTEPGRRGVAVGVALAVAAAITFAAAGDASAAEEQELENARGFFDSSQYATAAARFAKLLDEGTAPCPKTPDLTPNGCRLTEDALVQRARSYYASSLVALGRDDEAAKEIANILRDSPTLPPSPAIFSQRGIDLYLKVRGQMEAELAKKALEDQKRKKDRDDAQKRYDAWVTELEKTAATETVVTSRSRWIAAIPFGVGQFQNDDGGLGVFFMALEGAEVTTAIVTGALHWNLVVAGNGVQSDPSAADGDALNNEELNARLERLRIANEISIGALAVTVIAGIIEAEVSFEDDVVTTRPRSLPPKPRKPEAPVAVRMIGVPNAPDAQGLGLELRF